MNIAAYKAIYQRFGLLATLHDFCISAIEKIVRFRLLLVYVHKDLGPINTPPIPGLDIRVMSAEELEAHVGAPGLDLPRSHIEQAWPMGTNASAPFWAINSAPMPGMHTTPRPHPIVWLPGLVAITPTPIKT